MDQGEGERGRRKGKEREYISGFYLLSLIYVFFITPNLVNDEN